MASSPKGEEKDIKQARRRLSVMSDNKLVEGFADAVNLDDEEVIAAANEHGMAMVFTGTRHFKH